MNNKISLNIQNSNNTQKEFSSIEKFNNLKTVYDNFSNKMKNSDFSNSITRYEAELSLLDNMEKTLDKQKDIKEFEFIQKAKKNAIEGLSKLGVYVKNV